MTLNPPRWHEITPSDFAHEREGLAFVRALLPDVEPYRAWSNFEFIAGDGSINEVDLLVLAPSGLFVVELKHWAGTIRGGQTVWQVTPESGSRSRSEDNPLLLTNRKAQRLRGLLESQPAFRATTPPTPRLPFVGRLVFLSHPHVKVQLDESARTYITVSERDTTKAPGIASIGEVLTALPAQPAAADGQGRRRDRIDRRTAEALEQAVEQAGIRPTPRRRRVGNYDLSVALGEGPGWQDFAAEHTSLGTRRRIRIYSVPQGTSGETRRLIDRAARREFQLLEGVQHQGVLAAREFTESERGPALVFDDDPHTQRLDLWMNENGESLTFAERLEFVREVAEALRYAHGKQLTHRALSPQSVLVRNCDSRQHRYLQVFNWQTAHRDGATSAARTSAGLTAHIGELVEPGAEVYCAPELVSQPESADPVLIDVFSLGALTWFLLTGKAPATSYVGLLGRLKDDDGLQISAALDGASEYVQELVHEATRPRVTDRLQSVDDVLQALDLVELDLHGGGPPATPGGAATTASDIATPQQPDQAKEATATTTPPPTVDNPTEATPGDVLDGGFVVRARLGSGSTAVAFLVTDPDDDTEAVLKVALDVSRNEWLTNEGEVLAKLRYSRIVGYRRTVDVGGHTGLVLERAGATTLRKYLRENGALTVDFLARFGGHLLDAVRYLEQMGIPHRDIKPENLGIAEDSHTHERGLVLFDFSLSRRPIEDVRAGTAGYLDPFLVGRERWDLYAERYAAAATLHEMTTGSLPKWGDGRSDPYSTGAELVLDVDLFPTDIRAPLLRFFAQAFDRDETKRFDTADDMLRAWQAIFAAAEAEPPSISGGHGTSVAEAELRTPLLLLDASARARNAFERLDLSTVDDLLRTPLNRLTHLRGVGNKTRREIVSLYRRLYERFPDVDKRETTTSTLVSTVFDTGPAAPTVDELVGLVLPVTKRSNSQEKSLARAYLGLDRPDGAPEWPSRAEVARACEVTPQRVGQVVQKLTERAQQVAAFTTVRTVIATALGELGHVATAAEVAAAVLQAQSSDADPGRAAALAAAAVRVAYDVELGDGGRWVVGRTRTGRVLFADEDHGGQAVLDYALRLGTRADDLVAGAEVVGAARVVEELQRVDVPAFLTPLPPSRLVQLAAAVSRTAASTDARLELYPRGLAAERALRLAYPALLGARELTVEQLRERVAARYPAAAPLPDRPELDALLADAGLSHRWDPDAADGKGAYRLQYSEMSGLTGISSTRVSTTRTSTPAAAGTRRRTHAIDETLQKALGEQFLVLVTPAKRLAAVEARLAELPVRTLSVEARLLHHLHAVAAARNIPWSTIVSADAAEPGSTGWRNLGIVVGEAFGAFDAELRDVARTTPVLLTSVGPFARYDQMGRLERLRDDVGRHGGLRSIWLLVVGDEQSDSPRIDGAVVPILSTAQRLRLPRDWAEAAAAPT